MSFIKLTEPILDSNNKVKGTKVIYIAKESIVAIREWDNVTHIATTNGPYFVLESPSSVIEKCIRAEKASKKQPKPEPQSDDEWLNSLFPDEEEEDECLACPYNPKCPF